ncbi:MAG: serine hydrolase domain-containing protein [Thermotogota bacterium]
MHEANPLGPGLSVTLTNRDGSFGELAYGVTDAGTGLDTPFQIGSITKAILGVTALRLVEKGLLDLDASVTQYLGWFQVPSKNYAPITVRHPIAHTSGPICIIDSVPASKYTAWMLRDTRTLFPPGERFHSSNVGTSWGYAWRTP